MPRFCRLSVTGALLFLLALLAVPPLTGKALAVPVTTKYYSVELPPDWVVVNGPAKVKDAVQVLLGQKNHKASALIIVGPARPGEAEVAAKANAQRLGGSSPVLRQGQWEFAFEQQGLKGYGIVREDAPSGVLLMLVVSGDFAMADFVYKMRGPYKALMPLKPKQP
ncbi:MAG: hypothetical protein DESF_02372 [Desulfovibrio sp.]